MQPCWVAVRRVFLSPGRAARARRPALAWKPRRARLVILGALSALLVGCAGYQIGPQYLYPPDIHTVYVPMFESNSYRLHLGERLTEAVVRQINQDTPFRVVASSAGADSILRGRLISDTRHAIGENAYDQPREMEVNLAVEVMWVDRRNRELRPPQVFRLPPQFSGVTGAQVLVPEVGHSDLTAQQRVIEQIARQVVGMMEAPW